MVVLIGVPLLTRRDYIGRYLFAQSRYVESGMTTRALRERCGSAFHQMPQRMHGLQPHAGGQRAGQALGYLLIQQLAKCDAGRADRQPDAAPILRAARDRNQAAQLKQMGRT